MLISIIVAMDENNLIGENNDLPWHIPADLAYFKKMTLGKPILMGRKTYDSIGRPLPNRRSIIITRNTNFNAKGCDVVLSINDALNLCKKDKEVMIIGGASIFNDTLLRCDKLYITEIKHKFNGDIFFPVLNKNDWQESSRESFKKDDKNNYDYDFVIYYRK